MSPSPEEREDSIRRAVALAGEEAIKQDAVIAKLREELARVNSEWQVLLDIHAALGIKWGDDPYTVINKLKQLAHQQPSANTSKLLGPVDFRPPDETRYPGYGKDFRATPSAPMPDVEKVADTVNKNTGDDILSMVMDFQNGRATASQLMDRIAARCEAFAVQALAPLVAALRKIVELERNVLPRPTTTYDVARAALTGTEKLKWDRVTNPPPSPRGP